jgi:hypothetical protein
MFGQNREQIRLMYQTSWEKFQQNQPLEGVESLIVAVLQQHPEYQSLLTDPDALMQDFIETNQVNPFLHMGMHISLAEQLGADRPVGIRQIYQQFVSKAVDSHQAEHQMIACLEQVLWEAQATGTQPDEQAYLQQLQGLNAR